MDKTVIDQFWRERSAEGGGRWTEPQMLDFEVNLLSKYVGNHCRILDLGSGPATLSLRLLLPTASLTAVDKYPDFLSRIPIVPNVRTVCSDILSFNYDGCHDLILLFGVVTHLEELEEQKIYEKMAQTLSPSGTAVVKNQISPGIEKILSGFSKNLQCQYVARYPSIDEQAARLKRFFNRVDITPYPDQFNKWPDTQHVSFICSQ